MKKTYSKKNRLKITAIILSTALIAASSGCSKKESETVNKELYNTPLSEYIETSQYMQEKISINFDTSEIEWQEKANIYDCKLKEFDVENIKDKLLKGKIIEESTESISSGTIITYTTDIGEYLSCGGWQNLSYNGVQLNKRLNFPQNSYFSFNDQLLYHNLGYSIDDYGQNTDLDGQTGYKEVLDNFMDTLERIGIKDVEPYISYSLDCETMNRQAELGKEYEKKFGMESIEEKKVYTKEDEGYLMLFRQTVDSIPVLSKDFLFVGLNDTAPTTHLVYEYSDFSINNFSATFWIDVDRESAQENQLLSPSQAMENLLKSYDDTVLLNNLYIDDMELSYIALIDMENKDKQVQDRVYILTPVWAFEVGEDMTVKYDEIEYETTYTEYNYILIDAVSGERISTPYIDEK